MRLRMTRTQSGSSQSRVPCDTHSATTPRLGRCGTVDTRRLFLGLLGHHRKLSRGMVLPFVLDERWLMFIQYLLPTILFVIAALAGVYWPRIVGTIHVAGAIAAAWFFHCSFAVVVLIALPLALTGVAYAFGRPSPRRWAVRVIFTIPLTTLVAFGAYPAYRVSHRHDDGDRSARRDHAERCRSDLGAGGARLARQRSHVVRGGAAMPISAPGRPRARRHAAEHLATADGG